MNSASWDKAQGRLDRSIKYLKGFIVIIIVGTAAAMAWLLWALLTVGQHNVDVTRCAGGPPEAKTDLVKYRARVTECERFYAEEKP